MTDKPTPQPEPTAEMTALPDGFSIEQDQDGDWVLVPPLDVTIFSVPGEGWMVTDCYMQGRDWDSPNDIIAACQEYLKGPAQ